MSQTTFTRANLERLEPPKSGRVYHSSIRHPGLALCVTAAGSKTFYLYKKVNGKPLRIRLGKFSELTVATATKLAQKRLGEIADGRNPVAEKKEARRRSKTFGDAWELFVEHAARHKGEKAWSEDKRYHETYLTTLGARPLSLDVQSWVDLLERLFNQVADDSGKVSANRLRALVSKIFNLATRRGWWDHVNPTVRIPKFKEQSRERVVSESEMPALLRAMEAEPCQTSRDVLMVALLTGIRIGNCCGMRWDCVNLKDGTWDIPKTKNGTSQKVHLPPQLVEILEARQEPAPGEFVFPTNHQRSKTGHITIPKLAWAHIKKRSGLHDLHIHDLRRTVGTFLAKTGASPTISKRVLGQKSDKALAIYQRLALDDVRVAQNRAVDAMLQAGGRGGQ